MTKQKTQKEEKEMQAVETGLREVGLKRHMTVRIPRSMSNAVEEFLKTDESARMGFDSKADVVTAAIRQLLMEYGFFKIPLKKEEKP